MTTVQKAILIAYAICAIIYAYAKATANVDLHWMSKPLLMPLLWAFFVLAWGGRKRTGFLFITMTLALLFSLFGDVFLIDKGSKINFLLGLVSFLVMHLCYIAAYVHLRRANYLPDAKFGIAGVAVYAAFLLIVLWPHVGSMLVPVIVYALALSTMVLAALNLRSSVSPTVLTYLLCGAVLFMLSDSALATAKFVPDLSIKPLLEFFVTPSYVISQFLIVWGVLQAVKERDL